MRLIFMGTPDFAVPSLQALLDIGHDVCAVFCQPDRPKGRGRKLQAPPIKVLAQTYELPVYQPDSLRNDIVFEQIRQLSPDVIIVVAYGKILPKNILELPRFGCMNVHGSLLPKYRGAAPIQWSIIHGETITGVTTMRMSEGLDTGDIYLQAETPIAPDEHAGELFDRLKDIGAALLIETLKKLENGDLIATPQDDALATYAPMLNKSDAKIDWNKPAISVKNHVNGMYPWPCAYTVLSDKTVKVMQVEVVKKTGPTGLVINDNGELLVYCKEDAVKLIEVQPENGKRMLGRQFLLGHRLENRGET